MIAATVGTAAIVATDREVRVAVARAARRVIVVLSASRWARPRAALRVRRRHRPAKIGMVLRVAADAASIVVRAARAASSAAVVSVMKVVVTKVAVSRSIAHRISARISSRPAIPKTRGSPRS